MDKHFIVETDIQAVVLTNDHSESVVWLTSTSTGEPVEGAKVYIYKNTNAKWQVRILQQSFFPIKLALFFFTFHYSEDDCVYSV